MKLKIALLAGLLMATVTGHAQDLQVGATAVYGFKLKETGVSVEAGKVVAPGHFFGLEGTFFRIKENDSFNGLAVRSREYLSTGLLLYRFNWTLPPAPQLSLYVGGAAGMGWTRLRTTVPALNYAVSDRSSDFAAEGQAGVEWAISKRWAVKAGYRYFRIYDVNLFGSKADIHDNLAEAGVIFRF